MNKPWVKESGVCCQADVEKTVSTFRAQASPFDHFIAFFTDRLVVTKIDRLPVVLGDIDHLLELRIFSKMSELRFFRSMMGKPFTYRFADDTYLDAVFILESVQKLDIDTNNAPTGEARYGGTLVRSTGGGVYELPVSGATYVMLVRYLSYNENGMACEADFRVKCFVGKES